MKKQCSIKDSSGKCKAEMDVYKESFEGNEPLFRIPINISYGREVPEKNVKNLNETWIAEHLDGNKVLIGAHYIYWNLENEELVYGINSSIRNNMLEPVM